MYKFNVIKIKDYILPSMFLCFTICLIIFSASNLTAAKTGLQLWANSVVPSLFPFFVATDLLSKTNIPKIFGLFLDRFMRPIFNIDGKGSFALIMGIISGYPVGAKIATQFRKDNTLPKEECERLLSFTNNSGPLFIIGTVGINMFGSSTIGFLLLFTHILACISVGFLFRFWKKSSVTYLNTNKNQCTNSKKQVSFSSLGEILAESITSSISTILMIGGFVVLFSVIISIFKISHIVDIFSNILTPICSILNIPSSLISSSIIGFLEITNGISLISAIHIKEISLNIIMTAFLLGFGGLSVFFQVFSIVSKTDLSIKPYIIGKVIQGILASLYTFLFIELFPVFNFNL